MSKDQKCLGCQKQDVALGKRQPPTAGTSDQKSVLGAESTPSENLTAPAPLARHELATPASTINLIDNSDLKTHEREAVDIAESAHVPMRNAPKTSGPGPAKLCVAKKFDALSLLAEEQTGEEVSLYSKTLIKKRP